MIAVVSTRLLFQQQTWRGGEPVAVDQQAHDALRIDPPLLGLTRLPQVVLTLSLEVERGHSCRHRASTLVAMT